jgi:hypothetical protein
MAGGRSDGEQLSAHVHQATGIISVHAECTIPEALVLLRRRAEAMGQSLEHTALDVLDGLIHFRET